MPSHSQFTIITNHEQRAKYKEEFNADYNKYLELKARTDEVTCEFNKLKDQLAECPKKSEEYKVGIVWLFSVLMWCLPTEIVSFHQKEVYGETE